jgi:hypothetical protein
MARNPAAGRGLRVGMAIPEAPPAPPNIARTRDVSAAEEAAREAPEQILTADERARLAAEAARDEDA